MKETWLKQVVRSAFFPNGAVRRIRFGALAGQVYRVSDITGMAAWYSGSEQDHLRMFKQLVKHGDTVVDVGANWGVHTLFLSKAVGTGGRVIAVEPLPRALEELKWHVEANGFGNVAICPVALCEREGEASFVATSSASTGHLKQHAENGENVVSVKTTTLDALLAQRGINSVSLVKVDVEGAESSVLEGAGHTLANVRPHWIIELHTPEQDIQVARRFKDAGYRLCRLDGKPILRPDEPWPHPDGVWGSILAKPA